MLPFGNSRRKNAFGWLNRDLREDDEGRSEISANKTEKVNTSRGFRRPPSLWRMLRLGNRPINVPESTAVVGSAPTVNKINETAASIADALLEQKMSDAEVIDSWLEIDLPFRDELNTPFRRSSARNGNTGAVPETPWGWVSSPTAPATSTTTPAPTSNQNISSAPPVTSSPFSSSAVDEGNSAIAPVGNAGSPGLAYPFYEKCMQPPFLTSVAITMVLCATSFLPSKVTALGLSVITGISSTVTVSWLGYNYVKCELY